VNYCKPCGFKHDGQCNTDIHRLQFLDSETGELSAEWQYVSPQHMPKVGDVFSLFALGAVELMPGNTASKKLQYFYLGEFRATCDAIQGGNPVPPFLMTPEPPQLGSFAEAISAWDNRNAQPEKPGYPTNPAVWTVLVEKVTNDG
jgi:hypothetical protein